MVSAGSVHVYLVR